MAAKKPKDPNGVVSTLRYRLKDASKLNLLDQLARSVNFVWNYCNEISFNAIRNHSKWLSAIDLKNLTSGSAKELAISSVTVQAICEEYVIRRMQFKKRKLRWRASSGSKKSIDWIPFKANSIQIRGDRAIYMGHEFRIWLSRPIDGRILTGSFSQDARGHWYVHLACEVARIENQHQIEEVGVDLGLKISAVLSDGSVIENQAEFKKLEEKLGKAQRAKKKKQTKKIHAKIKNKRRDYLHKKTTQIAKKYHTIFIGDVSGKFGTTSTYPVFEVISLNSFGVKEAFRHEGFAPIP